MINNFAHLVYDDLTSFLEFKYFLSDLNADEKCELKTDVVSINDLAYAKYDHTFFYVSASYSSFYPGPTSVMLACFIGAFPDNLDISQFAMFSTKDPDFKYKVLNEIPKIHEVRYVHSV
jgi:hypothetical protein